MNGADYDPETKVLTIQFTNGAVYRYGNVDPTKADTLFQTSSAGGYFHDKIKGNHPEQKIVDGMTKSGRRSSKKY